MRYTNVRSVERYAAVVEAGGLPVGHHERLTERQRLSERLFLGLRTARGLRLDHFQAEFGVDLLATRGELLGELSRSGLLLLDPPRLTLTARGLAVADGIAGRLSQ